MSDCDTHVLYKKIMRRLSRLGGAKDMLTFHRMVVGTLLTQGVLLGFSTAASIMVTRSLGAEGRGIYSWVMSYSGFATCFVIMGIGQATKKYVAKSPSQASTLIILNFAVLGTTSLIFLPVFYFYGAFSPVAAQNQLLFLIAILCVPLFAFSNVFNEMLVGLDKGLHYNIINVVEKVFYILLSIALVALDKVEPLSISIALTTCCLLRVSIGASYILPYIRYRPSIAQMRDAFRQMRTLIFCSWFAVLAMYYTNVLLTFVLGATVTTRELGYYSTARFVVDTALMLPSILGLYTMPRLMKEKTHEGYVRVLRHILLLTIACMSLAAGVLFLFSDSIVTIVFGHDFMSAGGCLKVMSVGMAAYGIIAVAQVAIMAHHREIWVMALSASLALCATIFTLAFQSHMSALTASYIYSGIYVIGVFIALGIVVHLHRTPLVITGEK